jgi:hypothetical protein
VAFLTTLLTSEKRDRLRSLLTNKSALSNADFKELNTMIAGNDVAAVPVQIMAAIPDPGQSALNTMPGATVPGFGIPGASIFNTMPATAPVQTTVKSYVRTKVEELLLDYGRNYPLVNLYLYRLHFLYTSQLLSAVGWSSSLLLISLFNFACFRDLGTSFASSAEWRPSHGTASEAQHATMSTFWRAPLLLFQMTMLPRHPLQSANYSSPNSGPELMTALNPQRSHPSAARFRTTMHSLVSQPLNLFSQLR